MASFAGRPIAERLDEWVDPVHRLFELSLDLLGTASVDGFFTRLNPAWERALGWSAAELMYEPFVSFVHPDDADATMQQMAALGRPGTLVTAFENRYRTRDGGYRCLQWAACAEDGVVYFVAKDVTDRHSREKVERDHAVMLSRVITDSVAEGLYVADARGQLTLINPAGARTLGYASEDELLGRGPHECFHHHHLDGTPFPIEDCLLATVRHTGIAVHVDEDTFWRRDGTPVAVSYSSAPIELVGGTGSVVAFRDITHRQAERDRLREQAREVVWFERVREALDANRFELHAQPIVSLATGSIVKHELLLRLRSVDGELVLPGAFLPAAERYGLIAEIDCWVITQAVELAAAGHPVAVNLAAASLMRLDVLTHIERELERTAASPQDLTFEVTETAIMGDVDQGRQFAQRLVDLGCTFSLDDFGTGYGSLTYLRQLPVSSLKIDLQFVSEITRSPADRKLVQAVVHIAKSLGKGTVAEGVEDQETLELLRDMDVDCVQGYYCGRPAPLTNLVAVPESDPGG